MSPGRSPGDIVVQAESAPDVAITGRRNRSLVFATATSGLAKIVSVVLNALTIPIAVKSLGTDGYGLWTTITSIASFLVFADFGLSNGLVAVISEAHGKRDKGAAIRAVSTTFFVLLASATVLAAAAAMAGPSIPWAAFLKLDHSPMARDVNVAVVWFLVLQIVNVPALISQKVQIGYQEMYWTNSWQIVGSILSFAGVVIASSKHLGLVPFVILFSSGPLIAQIVASCVLFGKLRPWLMPRFAAFDWNCVRDLFGTGGVFVLLQLLAVLGNSSDQIILTRYLGLAAVAEYSLTQRLFSGTSIIQFFLVPLWPAFGEALSAGDHVWARRALKHTLRISILLSTTCAGAIALAAPWISARWVPQIHSASPSLLAAFVASSLIGAYGGTMSVFLNNRKTIRAQLGFYGAASFAALLMKLWLVRTIGISGAVWGTFLGYGVIYTVPAWRLAQKTLNDLCPEPMLDVEVPLNP